MIAVLTTHPIQYQIPFWRLLSERARAPVKVYFLSRQGLVERHDPGFGRAIAWDVDLLGGFAHEFAHAKEGVRQDSFFWLSLAENLPRRMRAEGARVVWLQGWQVHAYWQAAALASLAGLPLWLRGDTNQVTSRRGLARRWALAALFSRVDRFFCVGSLNRDYYVSRGVSPARIEWAPHGVDNRRLIDAADALRPARARLRQAFGVPEGAFCVAFVGKLTAHKRPFDLTNAARILNARGGAPVHLIFVGDGAMRAELKQQCPEATVTGFLNQREIVQAYVAADCLALPSTSETWGLVVNEAMAAGTPVVVSDACGSAADLVAPHWPAHVHRCGDAMGLAEALAAVRAAPPSREALRAVVATHDPLVTVEAVERAYAQLKPALPFERTQPAPDTRRA